MKKKLALVMTVLVLCLSIVAGATFALLNDTKTATNVFVADTGTIPGGNKVKVDLLEPTWVAANGLNYLPGAEIPKDPHVKSTGGRDCWIALVVYGDGAGSARAGQPADQVRTTLTQFEANIGTIDWNTASYTEVPRPAGSALPSDARIFILKTKLNAGATSPKLFTKVVIRNTISDTDLKAIDIKVDCYAVQYDLYTSDAKVALKTQWPTLFNFA